MEEIIIDIENDQKRLDVILAEFYSDLSRSHFQKLIKDGEILVNGEKKKPSYKCQVDDVVSVGDIEAKPVEILPEDIPLDILYEDEDLLVVNKPKNMVVHPAPGHPSGTLVNAIMYHCGDSLSGINGEIRPGIVHRIDRDTTGSLVICKNDTAHISLAKQMKDHSVNRIYLGIVIGSNLPDEGMVDAPIGRDPKDRIKMAINERNGKNAITHYKTLAQNEGYGLMAFRLETGRTHQIRVHMASLGYPLLGDEVYGPKKCPFKLEGQSLHAYKLGFIHPGTDEYLECNAPIPEYFSHLLDVLHLPKPNLDDKDLFVF
ncbi:MAG: RluA family pseudouridine synthase [Lachnospiraceae bacterium]|nr:RluA family pseudouridine synthase [Lachnospiraceae bacterium]